MQTNLPVILSDRDPVIVLTKNKNTVISAMREWGIGRVDKKETIHFCGLIHHPEEGAVVFLPREAKTGDPVTDMKTASLTMQSLARFGVETSKRDFAYDGDVGNPGALSVIKRLADDFQNHGLFSQRIRQRTMNSGKPDWMNTVQREIALPGHKGQPIFTNIRSSRPTRSSDALLSQIQAAVIREIHLAHAWWLTGTSHRREELSSCQRPPFPRTTWALKLETMLPSLYSVRSIFIAKYLAFYLRKTRASTTGSFVFGIEDFHTVWETMLRETITRDPSKTRRNWNSILPKPVYSYNKSTENQSRTRGMQIDIILEDKKGYSIIDAKYYGARSADSAPGWPDIAKQMLYEKALLEVLGKEGLLPARIDNFFVFPKNADNQLLTKVEMKHEDGSNVSDAFPTIGCLYVSMQDCLHHYSSKTQGIRLQN